MEAGRKSAKVNHAGINWVCYKGKQVHSTGVMVPFDKWSQPELCCFQQCSTDVQQSTYTQLGEWLPWSSEAWPLMLQHTLGLQSYVSWAPVTVLLIQHKLQANLPSKGINSSSKSQCCHGYTGIICWFEFGSSFISRSAQCDTRLKFTNTSALCYISNSHLQRHKQH